VAYRGHDRFVQSVETIRMDRVTPRLRERGVYVITGGFGGLGYTLAQHLAKTYRAKLVLIGRSAGGPSIRARATALEALGGEVEVVSADVTSVDAMRAALTRAHTRFGVVNGVFHTAGVLGDSLMSFKTSADAERVLAPKVRGTMAIDAALGNAPLDLFVLFSSISSIAGLPGQADYTAANAFLDAFAQERSLRDGTFAVAINWSAWRDVGMAAKLTGSSGEESASNHPLLGRRIWSSGGEQIFASELSAASHWVLAEHRLRGGRPLMPGTGMIEIARAAAAGGPAFRPLELRDVAFISAFATHDDAARELRVRVSFEEPGGRRVAGSRIAIASQSESDAAHWQEHLTATAAYIDEAPPADLDIAAIAARCTRRLDTVAGTERDAHMNFGARWHNIESASYGEGEALLTLELPATYTADFDEMGLHPALLDMATGGAQTLIPQWNWKKDFFVPLGYGQVRVFAPLPSRIHSHIRLVPSELDAAEHAVFNATITDESGRVLVEATDFMMTRLAGPGRIEEALSGIGLRESSTSFEPPTVTSQAPMLQGLEDAIAPAEGMDALERILAGPALPQLFATPVAVTALIEELRLAQPGPATATAAAPPVPSVPLDEIESALAEHEAVRECAVMQRSNRTGRTTIVAYVVHKPDEHATVSDLRRFLKARLPAHLVPSTLIDLDSLPRTGAGVVDRSALPDPFGSAHEFVAPRTATERMIADIWQDILGIDRVSVRDNFFDAGGHSLLAVRVITRINKAIGVRLSQTMMVLQTLEQIAAECDRRGSTPTSTQAVRATPPAGTLVRRLFKALRSE
jgi:NAD(P)-dependent dehydrogenase (short-subunit alcohol dehydrogenase family)